MIKILGLGDISAASLLLGMAYQLDIPRGLIISLAIYLFFKALIFFLDIGSFLDIGGGILLILGLSISLPQPLLFIFAGFLGLKGILSLLG